MTHCTVDQTWAGFLGRPIQQRDDTTSRTLHAGRSVLLTGAAGSIGSVLARAIAQSSPRRLILLDRSTRRLDLLACDIPAESQHVPIVSIAGNICHAPALDSLFATHQPEVVYHTAAFKHVPQLENDPFAAIRNNALGTYALAQAAIRQGSETFVMISTDKAVNPHSIMGATKRIAEMILMRAASGQTCMRALRLGNVMASRGSVVPIFSRQILHGGPVTVTHSEVSRYFLTLEEAGTLTLAAASLCGNSGILVPHLGSTHRIVDLARYMIGGQVEIPVVFTGLRPGEKMIEEMTSSCETVDPKPESALYRGHHTTNDLVAALQVVQRMVPEFNPSNTLMALLDSHHPRLGRA